jgi:hypothetical protein
MSEALLKALNPGKSFDKPRRRHIAALRGTAALRSLSGAKRTRRGNDMNDPKPIACPTAARQSARYRRHLARPVPAASSACSTARPACPPSRRARIEPVRAFSIKDEAVRFAGRQLGGYYAVYHNRRKFGPFRKGDAMLVVLSGLGPFRLLRPSLRPIMLSLRAPSRPALSRLLAGLDA